MRTVKYLGTGVTHEALSFLSGDPSSGSFCGAPRSGNCQMSMYGTVDCQECLRLRDEIENPEAFVKHWYWPTEILKSVAACRGALGTCHRDTGEVTCPDCKAIPEFRKARADQLREGLIHLHTGNGETACGASGGGGRLTDPAQVTCIACLESEGMPEVEKPTSRRILLNGND